VIRALPVLLVILVIVALFLSCGTTLRPSGVPAGPGAYAEILDRFVDGSGRVDYAALSRESDLLDAAYAEVAARGPARGDALAWWIDAYNLTTLVGVVRLRPETSVRDVASPFPASLVAPKGAGFFYFTQFVLGGESISLYDLEHDVIRGFHDARIHFAINCASISCPRLQRRPFRGDGLDRRLDGATREFVADPEQVRIDAEARVVRLNPILDWFREDFGDDLLGFLIPYAAGARADLLRRARAEGWRVEFFEYDWRLNGRE